MPGSTVRYVLCCDDDYVEETFDRYFEEDAERRRRSGRDGRLQRYGPVRPSVSAAQGALATALRHDDVPSVVLMDDWLSTGHGSISRGAFELLRWIVATFDPAVRPACILMTSRFDAPTAHAFCELGGTQAIDKIDPWEKRTETIWAAIEGVRWRHEPDPPLIRFTRRDLEILPYLMADISSGKAIAAGLGRPAADAKKIHESRRALHRRLHDAGLIDWPLTGQSVALARAALEAGAIWVPLEYR